LTSELPQLARLVAAAYLEAVDAVAPGLVEGLYLTGSVALRDFRPSASDVDFVAVTRAPLGVAQLQALDRAHARVRARFPRPAFEGIYVTWAELGRDPLSAPPGPHAHEGRLHRSGRAERHPVTWHTLASHGVAVRGPGREALAIWTDPRGLATWTLGNLCSYWQPWRVRRARLISAEGLRCLGSWAPSWGVLGVSRLHYTLATGQITSKSGAGDYALEAFPARWHRVVAECLRIRRGGSGPSLYLTPLARRREALAFIAMVIDDAPRLARTLW
jgi:hypothetical protein